jgi:hypothetical protein
VNATKKDDRYVTEDVIERHLLKWVKFLGGITFKMRFMRGWPDRLVLLPNGRWFFVELKRPVGGKFEPLQERTHDKLRKRGFVVYVWKNKEEVDHAMSAL